MNCNNTFNKIFNEQNALKAFTRNVLNKKTIVDLNDRFALGLSLSKSRTFPRVQLKNHRTSKSKSALALYWNLAINSESSKNIPSYSETPLTKYAPSNGFLYRRTYYRGKKSLVTFRNNIKSRLHLYHPRARFAKFRDLYIKKSSLASKAFFFKLHAKRRYLFIRPKLSATKCSIYTKYNRKERRININYSSKSGVLSKRQTFFALFNKYYGKKHKLFLKSTDKNFNNIIRKRRVKKKISLMRMKLRGGKKISKTLIIEKLKAFFIKKQLSSVVPNSERLSLKKIKSFQPKELVKNYKNLNETNKEIIKQTIKGANLELLKSALLTKTSKFTSKRSFKYKAKKSKSPRVIEYNKRKFKVCDPRKSFLVTKLTLDLGQKKRNFSKKKSTKPKFNKKGAAKFKSKVSVKASSSKE